MQTKPILGYWNVRGRGAPIRHLLAYAQVDYEEVLYSEPDDWFLKTKPTIDLEFPNLPYYIDGNIRLTHTLTILQYLARKYGLDGSSESERNAIALVEQQLMDQHLAFSRISKAPNCEQLKGHFIQNLPETYLAPLSAYLGVKPFVAGPKITYVDFYLYEYLKKLSVMAPGCLEMAPNLERFIERIEGFPQMAPYFAGRHGSLFNVPWARWNGFA